jgi:tagatose 1,6-diphosphate aldolase GatY/KbaY
VIARFSEILGERQAQSAAVGAFTCYDHTTAVGVVKAAEDRGDPAILLVSESSLREGARFLLPALHAVAEEAHSPVCVQLDHATDLRLIEQALETGAPGAVLADGSRLPYDDNVAFVRAVRELAYRFGAELEVELGHVEGGEDVAAAAKAGKLTDPAAAATFVAEAEPACLAVSIGNVHGIYAAEPDLDWERLARLRAAVDVPLSLHGASGLLDDDVRRAVAGGIAKVNVNTEIRRQTFAELSRRLPGLEQGWRVLALDAAIVDVVREVVSSKLELFAGA